MKGFYSCALNYASQILDAFLLLIVALYVVFNIVPI